MTTPYENELYERGREREWKREQELRERAMPLIERENIRVKDLRAKYHFIHDLWWDSPKGGNKDALAFCMKLIEAEIEKVKEEAFKKWKEEDEKRERYNKVIREAEYKRDTWKD